MTVSHDRLDAILKSKNPQAINTIKQSIAAVYKQVRKEKAKAAKASK